jgi:hypothetical protein
MLGVLLFGKAVLISFQAHRPGRFWHRTSLTTLVPTQGRSPRHPFVMLALTEIRKTNSVQYIFADSALLIANYLDLWLQ